MHLKLCRILPLLLWLPNSYGYSDSKINVAFVIDDTGSMRHDIKEVKEKTQFIFNRVITHENSQVEEFILITFNDYSMIGSNYRIYDDFSRIPIKVRTTTRDPNIFYNALDQIRIVLGVGGDCPELALTGIKKAVEICKPNSYIYVFTDAHAKDFKLEDEIKTLALNKSIQITFILTGKCGTSDVIDIPDDVFKKIAVATSGEVFTLNKINVNEIINYIADSVQDPKTTLLSEEVKQGHNTHEFTVDDDMMYILISISIPYEDWGLRLNVIDPHGNNPPTIEDVNTGSTKIVKILEPEVGVYHVETYVPWNIWYSGKMIGGIVIRASINIDFQYHFLNTTPPLTRTSPIAGATLYVEIKVEVPRHVHFKLDEVVILDTDDNKLLEINITNIMSQKDNVYIAGPIKLPDKLFKITILGIDQNTGGKVKRIGRTFVEPDNTVSPQIDKSKTDIEVKEGSTTILSCRILKGSPVPTITWEFKKYNSNVFERLHEAKQKIYIGPVGFNSSGIYKCSANNKAGSDFHEIKLNVQYSPKINKRHNSIKAIKGSKTVISCRTSPLLPTPNMAWEFKRSGSHIFERLSKTDQEIVIDSVDLDNAGVYKCQASNEFGKDSHEITLNVQYSATVVSIKLPKTTKTGDEVILTCKITGEPAPKVNWLKDGTPVGLHGKYVTNNNSLRFIADLNDSGNYTCIASNTHGSDSRTAIMIVHDSPKIDKSKSNMEVKEGSTAVVSCRIVKGSPLPTITWEFKKHDSNQYKKLREAGQEINIDNVGLDTSGVYKCIATNTAGRDVHEVKLNVQYYPKIDKTENSITAIKGSRTVISCRTRNLSPTPNMKWEFKKPGSPIFERLSNTDQEIVIDSVDLDNAGVYKCQANNEFGKDSHEITLNVQYSPSIVTIELPKKANTGDEVVLTCKVTGEPAPKVEWLKHGTSIGLHGKYTTNNNSLRFIADLRDSGKYTCVATNIHGSDSNTATLVVYDSPTIDKTKSNIQVIEGSTAVISCRIVKGSPLPTITWEFKKHDLNKYERLRETGEEIKVGHVSLDTAGIYKCIATNTAGRDFHEIKLNVQYYPKIDKTVDSITVIKGSRAIVSCRARNLPPTPSMTWEFKRPGSHLFEHLSVKDYDIYIESVDLDNAGIYKCLASNEFGKDSHEITLNVQYSASVVTIEQPKKTLTGDEVVLTCKIIGEPAPKVEWLKDGASIGLNGKYVTNYNSLRFVADLKDSGDFTCVATNIYGSDSHTATLVIYDSPKIDKTQSNIEVIEGSTAVISCRIIKGSPLPIITWEFKKHDSNQYERLRETGKEIHIGRVGLDTAGVYKCIGTNIAGSDIHEIQLNVQFYPKIDKAVNSITAIKGSRAVISCRTRKLLPTPNMTWEFKRSGFHIFERLLETDQEIHIDSTALYNAGVYKCQASNEIGSDSHEITLTVQYAPTVFFEQPKMAKTGNEVILTCKITGDPKPNVKWFKDGKSIELHKKYVISQNHSIRFVADLNDVGIYTCTANNALGSDAKSVKFEVHEPVEIENPGKTEFNIVEYDMVVRLPCKATGHPKPTVTWVKDDAPLILDEYTYEQESDNTLVHKYPDLSSTGTYTCIASNNITSFTQAYKVNVSKYPIPSEPMDTLYLEKESSNYIQCNVPHSDLDYIRWFTNATQIQIDPFILRNASTKDNGIYSCRVDFDWGSESIHTKIIVGTKPKFVKDTYNKNVPFVQGRKLSLDCSVTGEPTPKITWWQNEIVLPETSMIYELQMKNSDIGIWRCEAENPLGITSRIYIINK